MVELRGDETVKIDPPVRGQPLDLRERRPRLLEREDEVQPLERRRIITPPPRGGTQRLDQPPRLIEAQRAGGKTGEPGNGGNVERISHKGLMPLDVRSASSRISGGSISALP